MDDSLSSSTELHTSSPWKISKPVLGLLVFVFVLTSFSLGMFVGRQAGIRSLVPTGEGVVLGIGSTPSTTLSDDVDFGMFWDVWNHVKDNYYRQPVSDKELFYGALHGLLQGAGDPYSIYFDPEEAQRFNEDLEGSFGGVGMEIGIRDEQLQVIAPLPGTPAEKAGLRAGDKIYAIDEEDTFEMSVEDAVQKIRGELGTEVVLLIGRDDRGEVEEVLLTRSLIHVDSLKWEMKDGIATLTLSSFNPDVPVLFDQAIQEMLTQDVKGIILDLRNDPGGRLDVAVSVASEWVDGQPVLLERIQGVDHPMFGAGHPRLVGIPTVVLVNGGSASASEIVAGALGDYDFATLVGETTFGKGSVQDYQELEDGSSVKLTVAEWLTPLGGSIHETGITPDIIIEYTREDFEAGTDPQMDVALQVLAGTYVAPEKTNE